MRILIATPTYEHMVHVEYMRSVIGVLDALKAAYPGAGVGFAASGSSLIQHNRNLHASMALNDAAITHLLMIDSDMAFEPSLILKMLALDKPLVGVLYPHRSDPLRFVGQDGLLVEDGKLQVIGGFARASMVGTGIILIRRDVLESIRARYPELY